MSTEIADQYELAGRVAKTYADLVRETLSPAEWEIMRQRNMQRRDIDPCPCASGDFLNDVAFMDRALAQHDVDKLPRRADAVFICLMAMLLARLRYLTPPNVKPSALKQKN
jgi:hypothetical protein